MKKLLATLLLVGILATTAVGGEIDVGGIVAPGPAPDGFLYVLLNGIWSLISLA